jgi:excisionase family DNA binding protein
MKSVFLTTAEVARMLQVNDSTVKRWTDSGKLRCIKTPGKHRKYQMKDVIHFMDAFQYDTTPALTPVEEKVKGFTVSLETAILMKQYPALSDHLYNTALQGNREATYEFLHLLFVNRYPIADIIDAVLFPVLRRIGNKWMEGSVGVEQEHLASNTISSSLIRLQHTVQKKTAPSPVVLIGCIEEEHHELPGQCAAVLLGSLGCTVLLLGANVPLQSFVHAINLHRPQIVIATSTTPKSQKHLINTLETLRETTKHIHGIFVAAGAAMFGKSQKKIQADIIPGSMKELKEFVSQTTLLRTAL